VGINATQIGRHEHIGGHAGILDGHPDLDENLDHELLQSYVTNSTIHLSTSESLQFPIASYHRRRGRESVCLEGVEERFSRLPLDSP